MLRVYASWETINLPSVTADTYFIIYDTQQSSPGNPENTGVIYSGKVNAGFGITNLNEILSQYVNPEQYNFVNDTAQIDHNSYKKFYLYTTEDDWDNFTEDEIDIFYDWNYSYKRYELADPITNIIDYRQLFVYSTKLNPAFSEAPVSIYVDEDEVAQFYVESADQYTYTYGITFLDYFGSDVTDDKLITVTSMDDYRTYQLKLTCNRYCLYYLNKFGGWDSLLVNGRALQTDNLSRLQYKKNYTYNYASQAYTVYDTDRGIVDYQTKINETWTLSTSWLTNEQSNKMSHLLESNRVFLFDMDEISNGIGNRILMPVNITNTTCEHKTYKNQGRKLYSYEITVESAKPKYRLN